MKRGIKPEKLVQELEDVADRLFGEVRHEQGFFQTGVCRLHGRMILLINKRHSLDERIAALVKVIADMDAERFYLKPAVRAEIERYTDAEDFAGHH